MNIIFQQCIIHSTKAATYLLLEYLDYRITHSNSKNKIKNSSKIDDVYTDSKNNEVYDKDGYNKLGFNKFGYDIEGFDIYGIDAEGYNREGYNKQGFDRFGYDINGFDSKGFNKDGYDINGFNRQGFDKEGFNPLGFGKDGYNREGYDRLGYKRNRYNAEGKDCAGNNKFYYSAQLFKSEERLTEAFFQLRNGQFRYSLFDIRTVLEECLTLLVQHYIGNDNDDDRILICLKICEDRFLLSPALIDKLHDVRKICNKNIHDLQAEERTTHGTVYFAYKVVQDLLKESYIALDLRP